MEAINDIVEIDVTRLFRELFEVLSRFFSNQPSEIIASNAQVTGLDTGYVGEAPRGGVSQSDV